jgi:hypothetical protein
MSLFLVPSIAAAEAPVGEPTQSIAGKSSKLTNLKIGKESDGQYYLQALSEDRQGFRVRSLGNALKPGKRVESAAVATFLLEEGTMLNHSGNKSSSVVEVTSGKPGADGKCSGNFMVKSDLEGKVYTASGKFTDIRCTND